jgi:acyl-CoA reductase-like NAD-dependent aldehyde dehydrogenase
MFETITPIDNSVLVKREYATEEDIEKSLSNSYSVREHWKNISLEERKKSVLNFVEIFLKIRMFLVIYVSK